MENGKWRLEIDQLKTQHYRASWNMSKCASGISNSATFAAAFFGKSSSAITSLIGIANAVFIVVMASVYVLFSQSYENFLPGESNISIGFVPTVSALFASKLCNGSSRNFCLFVHLTWLSANFSPYAGDGGGSVILVIRYAVDASATP